MSLGPRLKHITVYRKTSFDFSGQISNSENSGNLIPGVSFKTISLNWNWAKSQDIIQKKTLAFKIDKTFLKLKNTLVIKNKCIEWYLTVKGPIKLRDLLQKTDCFQDLQVQSIPWIFASSEREEKFQLGPIKVT